MKGSMPKSESALAESHGGNASHRIDEGWDESFQLFEFSRYSMHWRSNWADLPDDNIKRAG